MVASTSSSSNNLLLFAASVPPHQYAEHAHAHAQEQHLVRNTDHASKQQRGFLNRSHNSINHHIRGTCSTGNLPERIMMLETVCKNGGGFSSKSSINNKKKQRCRSDGNLKHLWYVLDTVTAPPLPVSVKSTDDDWFLGDEEEEEDIISDEEEKENSISDEEGEEDIITTPETTTRPAETIITTPSTLGRKSSPSSSPQKKEEKKIASVRVEAMKMKDTTIHFPMIENRASIGSSSSSSPSSSMGSSSTCKDSMLETTALSSASVSSLRSSASTSPAPAPTPTLNAPWSTNTSIEALKSMHRFFSILLSAPSMPDLFSCGITGGTGDTTSFDPQKVKKGCTKKKMSTCTTRTPNTKKKKHQEQPHDAAVELHLGRRLSEVKKELFFQLNLPSQSPHQQTEDDSSGRTATTTASSTCLSSSPEEQEEKEILFRRDTTPLSPRIMMFYQDEDNDEDDNDDENEEDTTATLLPVVSTLSSIMTVALSSATGFPGVVNDDDDVDDDNVDPHTIDNDCQDYYTNGYGIFVSFSDDGNENENQEDTNE